MSKNSPVDLLIWILLCVLITIGVFGNIISMYIWTRGKRCRKSKFSAFFVILSMLDTLLLLIPGLQLIIQLSPLEFYPTYHLPCKATAFIFQSLAQVSMWLIVCLTVTRTVFIYKPWLQIDKRNIYTLTVALVIVFAGMNVPHLLYDNVVYNRMSYNESRLVYIPFDDDTTISPNGSVMIHGKCKMSAEDINPLMYIIILQGAIFVCIPFIINFICNCLMILQLFRRMINARCLGNSLVSRAYRDVRAFTKRVIIISVSHCVFTIPQVVFDIHIQSVDYGDQSFFHQINYGLWHKTVTFLFYINSFSNLILYYTTGSDFKLDMKDLLRCKRNQI